MNPRWLVTLKEFEAMDRDLAASEMKESADGTIKESRLVRTCSMVHECVDYQPSIEPAHIRMSFFMFPRVYGSRRAAHNYARRFSYGRIGLLGSMAVELMAEDHVGTACSFHMEIKGKWPILYKNVAECEFPELLEGAELKDSRIYDRIQDDLVKLTKYELVTHVPADTSGPKYSFSDANKKKIMTLGC